MERSLTRDPGFWIMVVIGLVLMIMGPILIDMFTIMQITQYVVLSVFALSLAYIWGFGGILSFGQAAFFGLGAYAFAVSSISLGDTTLPLVLSFVIPAAFGVALGYFMFYGKLSDVYLGVVTMVVTLIFWKLANHTAGPEYSIAGVRLGGFNGIPSIPTINIPGQPDAWLDPAQLFRFFMGVLIVVYIALRILIASDFGRISIGIRENETRAALLGYDIRRHKVIVFAIGSGIAGLSGAMWATYQSFIDPNAFSMEMSAKALIWVMAGGVGTLLGPILGVIGLQWLTLQMGMVEFLNSLVVLGAIMMVLVLALPKGLVPTFKSLGIAGWTLWRRGRGVSSGVKKVTSDD